jgi:hypothetical protein
MGYDYSQAPQPRELELVPHGTIVVVTMKIRAGGAGEDGLLKRSKDGTCEMLDTEFTLVEGPYSRRKFWENLILAGTSDGHAKAAEISRGRLRTIIESARGIKPDDMSPAAREARTVELKDFDGVNFVAKIGVEKGGPKGDGSNYPDKNILLAALGPDKKDWRPVEQPPPWNGGGSGGAAPPASTPITKPGWAA